MKVLAYVYKITFEEVPHFYFGVRSHTDPKNDTYLGSPKTHKNYWEIYTPKKQILYKFSSWDLAYKVEIELIKQNIQNKYCLNEAIGGKFSLESLQRGGRIGGKITGPKNIIFAQKAFKEKYYSDPLFALKIKQKRTKTILLASAAALSQEVKQKRRKTFQKIKHQQGTKNSMYGTMWITDGTKEGSYRINKLDPIPEGYRRGRVCNSTVE